LSPVSVVSGVPESKPVLESVSPVPDNEPAVSDHVIAPIPPVDVSWYEYGAPTVAVGSTVEVIASVTGFTTSVTTGETAVTGGLALSVARKVTALPATTVGAVGVPDSVPPEIERPAGNIPEFSE